MKSLAQDIHGWHRMRQSVLMTAAVSYALTGSLTAVQARVLYHIPLDASADEVRGGALTCSASGPPKPRAGMRGNAMTLGPGGLETLTYSTSDFPSAPNWTLDLWLLPLGWKGTDHVDPFLIEVKGDDGWRVAIFKEDRRSNLVAVIEGDGVSRCLLAPIYDWKGNQWAQLLLCREGDDFRFYLNGEAAGRCVRAIEPPRPWTKQSGFSLSLAASRNVAVDEIRLSDIVLPPREIERNYVTARLREKPYGVPVVRIPFTAIEPGGTAGGDAAAWQNAAVVSDFSWTLSSQGERRCDKQTWVHLMYSEKKLHLLFKSPLPKGGLSGAPHERDITTGGDEVEFFVMPRYTETFDYFQFVGNAFESFYDSLGRYGVKWNGDWRYKCREAEGSWLAELTVDDFGPIAAPKPKAGDVWNVNFCRNWWDRDGGKHEWTVWSQTSGGYHSYKRFGKIIFGGKDDAVVRVRSVAEVDSAARKVAAVLELLNPSSTARSVHVQRDYYPPNDYLPFSTSTREVTLVAGKSETLRIENDIGNNTGGLVEITVKDKETGDVYLYQMVML
ncbi:MAG: hypothetical protein GW893_01780 [Armatimonadetes bacterium]|nr:hypothetical protein [Armatimonadota bacterium]